MAPPIFSFGAPPSPQVSPALPMFTLTSESTMSNDAYRCAKRNKFEELKQILTRLDVRRHLVECDDLGNTLLHYAVFHSNLQMIEYLLNYGFDMFKANTFGESPITRALMTQNLEVIKLFVKDPEIKTLRELNDSLRMNNDELTRRLNEEIVRNREIALLKSCNTRLRQENDDIGRENIELRDGNKRLKMTVENLMKTKEK